jgi:ketosteroid isomerase-like protein
MSMYAPEVIAYDIVPPLQYVGADAYRKDYEQFLAQYDRPLEVEFQDLKVAVGDSVAFAYGLERFNGTLKNGQKQDVWLRFSSCFREINGKWLDVHDHVSVPTNLENGTAALDLKP